MDPNQAVDVLWFYFGYSGPSPAHQPPAWGSSALFTTLRIGLPAGPSGFELPHSVKCGFLCRRREIPFVFMRMAADKEKIKKKLDI
jgi:hypothetical protein